MGSQFPCPLGPVRRKLKDNSNLILGVVHSKRGTGGSGLIGGGTKYSHFDLQLLHLLTAAIYSIIVVILLPCPF